MSYADLFVSNRDTLMAFQNKILTNNSWFDMTSYIIYFSFNLPDSTLIVPHYLKTHFHMF